jgi:hypothetical protein
MRDRSHLHLWILRQGKESGVLLPNQGVSDASTLLVPYFSCLLFTRICRLGRGLVVAMCNAQVKAQQTNKLRHSSEAIIYKAMK